MPSFWDTSWQQVDTERLARYIDGFDQTADRMIEHLLSQNAHSVCDAGCGCGIYSLKLAAHGFAVCGFDVSPYAVQTAAELLKRTSSAVELKTASILGTGYDENQFDAVISRDVIDHMSKRDGLAAIRELYRIVRPGGVVFITLDHLDSEYETEAHTVNGDGDYVFTDGKWRGMVFHPYTEQEIEQMMPAGAACEIVNSEEEILVKLMKSVDA